MRNYDIHNLLRIHIFTRKRRALGGLLNRPLEFFRVPDDVADPEIILNIGRFTPRKEGLSVAVGDCLVRDDYLYLSNSDKESEWEAEVSGLEEPPIEINFCGKIKGVMQILAPDILAQDQLLLPIIEIYLGMKGYPLLHGGGFCINHNGIAIIGGSGSRKTTVIMKAAEKGLNIIGDERIIFSEGRLVYPLPIWPGIMEYTIGRLRREDMNVIDKLHLLLYLRKERDSNLIWSRDPVRLSRIFILGKRRGLDSAIFSRLSTEIGVKRIMMDKKADLSASNILRGKKRVISALESYCLVNKDSRIRNYWKLLEERLISIIDSIPVYQVDIPAKSSMQEIDRIFNRMIESNIPNQ